MDTIEKKVKIRNSLFLIVFVFIIGVSGYMIIEKIPVLDAIYMTIITLSTIGFGEVKELSDPGKIFTIFLIITGLGVFAYAFSLITSYFFEGKLNTIIKGYITKSDIKKMKNHVIICGYGRNGRQALKELSAHKTPCIVIDQKIEKMISQEESQQLHFVEGDATEDDILMKAKIKSAKALITTLPLDADNLFVVLTARSLNKDLVIISRASSESAEKKLRVAGVNNVVMPEKIGGAHMATLVANPDLVEFLEHLSVHGIDPTNLEEIVCDNLPESFQNMTIHEIGIRRKSGANIIGFKTPEGKYILNPSPDTIVIPHSKLFVLGTPGQVKNMKDLLRDH